MRSFALASAFVLGLFAAGCSASADTTETAASSANDVTSAPACTNSQRVTYASDAQVDGAIAAFRAQNAGTWKIDKLSGVDGIQAAIRTATRTDAADATSLPANAESIARAFMRKNANLLHFTPEGMARADFFVSTFDGPNAVTLAYSGVRKGTEAYGFSMFDIIHLELWLAADGSIVKMQSFSSTNPDQIELCAEPPNAPIVDAIIGTDLVYRKPEFVPVTPPLPVGKVEASDIGAAEPVIYGDTDLDDDTGFNLVIAYRVSVTRGGHTWDFTVDATTGKVLGVAQQG